MRVRCRCSGKEVRRYLPQELRGLYVRCRRLPQELWRYAAGLDIQEVWRCAVGVLPLRGMDVRRCAAGVLPLFASLPQSSGGAL